MTHQQTVEAVELKTNTLIVIILDESGSMEVQKNDVLEGYQSFIEEQKHITDDQARLMLIKFNTNVTVSHCAVPIESAPELTVNNYKPYGGTALYDAVAVGIRLTVAAVQSDERVLFWIMTDGEENSSRKATQKDIREVMKKKEELGNWTFTYIGKNPEAWASSMDQSPGNVQQCNMVFQKSNMLSTSVAVSTFRIGDAAQSLTFFK